MNPDTTAVIAVHCQGDIIGPNGAFATLFHDQIIERSLISKIQSLQGAARNSGIKTVYTRIAWNSSYSDLEANSPLLQNVIQMGCLKEGNPLTDIIDELAPQPGDRILTHQRIGGFTSELHKMLQDEAIDTLLFCGVASNVSVESTARAASDAGYNVILVEDACSASSPEAHQATVESLAMFGLISTVDEIKKQLQR